MTSDDEGLAGDTDLFHEPDDYYLPEKPAKFVQHILQSGQELQLRLVGHNSLWGHLLWNAGKMIAQYLEDNAESLVKGKDVLELGAGAGLPSLVCAARGARQVVVTDYPDPDLIQNLQYNIEHCSLISVKSSIVAKGYLWGNDTGELKSYLFEPSAGFDLLILADILFNHSEHEKLASTVKATLKVGSNAKALVFFTPYRPWLLDKDLAFFDLAKSKGLFVQKIFEKTMEKAMFETDPGDEILRRTVFGYEMSQMNH